MLAPACNTPGRVFPGSSRGVLTGPFRRGGPSAIQSRLSLDRLGYESPPPEQANGDHHRAREQRYDVDICIIFSKKKECLLFSDTLNSDSIGKSIFKEEKLRQKSNYLIRIIFIVSNRETSRSRSRSRHVLVLCIMSRRLASRQRASEGTLAPLGNDRLNAKERNVDHDRISVIILQ